MYIKQKLINDTNEDLILFVLTNGEKEFNAFTSLKANVVHCHINSDGHNITQDELFSEKNVNHLMMEFLNIIKQYDDKFPIAKHIVIGSGGNAEVALDILLKENELVEGGILIKPILNVSITDGIRIEDRTRVLIIAGDKEADNKQIEEREIAEILEVNGYDVTLTELKEGKSLTGEDIQEAVNWIKKNFNK